MKPKAYHISIISGVFLIFMVKVILHLLCFGSSFVHQYSCYKYNNFKKWKQLVNTAAALQNTYQDTDIENHEVKTDKWSCSLSSLTSKSFLCTQCKRTSQK